jgi:hypothetical protein
MPILDHIPVMVPIMVSGYRKTLRKKYPTMVEPLAVKHPTAILNRVSALLSAIMAI